jgi:hypothetical protein
MPIEFILGRMGKSVEDQLGDVAVCDRIEFVLPLAPAGDEPCVAKPSEPLRYCRVTLAHRFGDIANAGFLPAQDFNQSQPAFIRDRPQHANSSLETPIAEVWLRQPMVGAIIFMVLLPKVTGS